MIPNQNNCLFELKRTLGECATTSCLNINVDEILNCVHEDIDTDKFKGWLEYNLDKIKSKTNQTSYLKKSFQIEQSKGTFKKEPQIEYLPNTQPLLNALREKGISVSYVQSAYISVLFDYLLNTLKINKDTLTTLNHQILDYMKPNQCCDDYIKFIKKSKVIKKLDIDWNYIDEKSKKELEAWEEMFEDINDKESERELND